MQVVASLKANMPIRDRSYLLKKYKKCFLGTNPPPPSERQSRAQSGNCATLLLPSVAAAATAAATAVLLPALALPVPEAET